ncbi:MAG: hypothetical protein KIT14_13965 [bacterium]|nr:hypothetical protein [bacterium]
MVRRWCIEWKTLALYRLDAESRWKTFRLRCAGCGRMTVGGRRRWFDGVCGRCRGARVGTRLAQRPHAEA